MLIWGGYRPAVREKVHCIYLLLDNLEGIPGAPTTCHVPDREAPGEGARHEE